MIRYSEKIIIKISLNLQFFLTVYLFIFVIPPPHNKKNITSSLHTWWYDISALAFYLTCLSPVRFRERKPQKIIVSWFEPFESIFSFYEKKVLLFSGKGGLTTPLLLVFRPLKKNLYLPYHDRFDPTVMFLSIIKYTISKYTSPTGCFLQISKKYFN